MDPETSKKVYFDKLHGKWTQVEGLLSNGTRVLLASKLAPVRYIKNKSNRMFICF